MGFFKSLSASSDTSTITGQILNMQLSPKIHGSLVRNLEIVLHKNKQSLVFPFLVLKRYTERVYNAVKTSFSAVIYNPLSLAASESISDDSFSCYMHVQPSE